MTDKAPDKNPDEETIIPLRGMRGMIADNMHKSLLGSAQLTHHAECDATELLACKKRLEIDDIRLSVEDLLIDCAVRALARHPGLNGRLEANEIHLFPAVHMSVAISLPGDLLVAPAIFDAQDMTLSRRAAARQDIVQRGRDGALSVKEMTGGTFTISNLGTTRVRFFTPILNPPQIAILGVGQTAPRPWVTDAGEIEIRPVMGLSLTFDHRAVNGAPAADFLTDLCATIETIQEH